MLHQIKAQQFYTDSDPYQQCWVLQEIGEFKAFESFSSTFQGRFYLQGLFKKALRIQVLSSLCKPCGGSQTFMGNHYTTPLTEIFV